MAYNCRAESGLQLMARLSSRLPLHGLEDVIFSGGPSHHDLVEISGDPATGKTLLLTQLLTKCLLPKCEENSIVGGLGVGVVLIDTDHHFQVFKLVNLMESWLRKCELADGKNRFGSKRTETIIKTSLKNLIVLSCHDSMQMLVNFHSLGKVLTANSNISLVVLDSASAYYWQDVMAGGMRKMDLYLKNTLGAMQRCIQEFKVVVMYTKQSYFQSKSNENSSELGKNSISYRISLHRMDTKDANNNMFYANISSPAGNKVQKYEIDGDGLKWIC